MWKRGEGGFVGGETYNFPAWLAHGHDYLSTLDRGAIERLRGVAGAHGRGGEGGWWSLTYPVLADEGGSALARPLL